MGVDTDRCCKEAGLKAAVLALLSEAKEQGVDRRKLQRKPYLKKVLIQPNQCSGAELTGFTREISNEGVGLLHAFPLDPKDIVIVIVSQDQTKFRLQSEITWCSPLGEGWLTTENALYRSVFR